MYFCTFPTGRRCLVSYSLKKKLSSQKQHKIWWINVQYKLRKTCRSRKEVISKTPLKCIYHPTNDSTQQLKNPNIYCLHFKTICHLALRPLVFSWQDWSFPCKTHTKKSSFLSQVSDKKKKTIHFIHISNKWPTNYKNITTIAKSWSQQS